MIDPARYEVDLHGQLIDLKNQEFNLLLVLVQHKGLVLSREQLLNLAWGYDYYGESRTVDVHIGQLRRKLAGSTIRIETITGAGMYQTGSVMFNSLRWRLWLTYALLIGGVLENIFLAG